MSALYRWSPPRRVTHSEMVCDLAAGFTFKGRRMVMDGAQRAILDDVFAEDAPGVPTCFEVVTIAPRQNIKSAVLQVSAIADVVLFGAEQHIWTAHLAKTATSAFRAMRLMIASDLATKAMFKWPPVSGKGQEVLETLDGRQIVFYSRSGTGGGRGETADKITVDEALYAGASDIGAILPTLMTVPGAQVRYASSGGLPSSVFLRDLRDRGRAGGDPRLGYHEFAAVQRECAQPGCRHKDLDDPGCALNDRELWFQANVAYPDRITEERILDMRTAMPPGEFARECLAWWDDPEDAEHPIDAEAWKRCGIAGESPDAEVPLSPVALAVECSNDLGTTTVGAAGRRPDGKAQVELIKRERGSGWVVGWVKQRVAKHRVCAVVVDPAGPAGFLAGKLRKAGVRVVEPSSREVAQACSDLQATVNEGKVVDPGTGEVRPSGLVHTRDVVLTSAVHAVGAKSSGAWERDNEKADVSALYAVTLALYGLTHPSKPGLTRVKGRVSGS